MKNFMTINVKEYPNVTGIKATETGFALRFGEDRFYSFDLDSYKAGLKTLFSPDFIIDDTKANKTILKNVNAILAAQEDDAYREQLRGIMITRDKFDLEVVDLLGEEFDSEWEDFNNIVKSMLTDENNDEADQETMRELLNWMSKVKNQNGAIIGLKPNRYLQIAPTGNDELPAAYFYMDSAMGGNVERWKMAVSPFMFFGQA